MSERILIVDDEPNIASSFQSLLKDEKYRADSVLSAEDAIKACKKKDYALILLDMNLPGMSGIEFITKTKEFDYHPTILVISGQSEISVALSAIKAGAVDYLEKPVAPKRLLASVRSALMLHSANRQRSIMTDQLDQQSQIIGQSKQIKRLLNEIDSMAISDATVLITGENGTGKELVASRLYLQSKRRTSPFIRVNCPGIPATLFESELFGHRKGAFTGAVKNYPGKFRMADGGTIFLDEIGDLPLECQSKLLRVLENGEVETLGAESPRAVDVRIICATNRDLAKLINEGKFREDLFYRISVLNISVPPLRKRVEDIPLLTGAFLHRFDSSGKTKLSPNAIAQLSDYSFPGNVRQLKNLIERLTILNRGEEISEDTIKRLLGENSHSSSTSPQNKKLNESIKAFEKSLIENTMRNVNQNISKAAEILGIDRANLSRKVKEYNLKNSE